MKVFWENAKSFICKVQVLWEKTSRSLNGNIKSLEIKGLVLVIVRFYPERIRSKRKKGCPKLSLGQPSLYNF